MTTTKISLTGIKARDKAVAGMTYVASCVRSTLGPYGQNVLLEKGGNKVTNDGFLISNELAPSIVDEFERRGALAALEASSKTNDMVGDATSTAWALTEAIVKEAVRLLPNERTIKALKTPSEIIAMIAESKARVLNALSVMATPITSKEELVKSALVSVEDEHVAELLGQTQWELGPEGVIIAEEVNEPVSSIERVNGIRLDNGFGTSMVITNPEKQSLEVQDMSILLTNHTIDAKDIIAMRPLFDKLMVQKKLGLVLIARAFTSEGIKLCMESIKAGFPIFPVNAPYVNQTEVMRDIEAVVGGRHIDVEAARLEDIDISDIGWVKRFVARQMDGVIAGVADEASTARIAKRVEELKAKLAGSQSEFEKRMIEGRIAQLTGGFAILKVGSQSVIGRKRLKDKCDDAVNAVRLALKGGTVRGAGLAFVDIAEKLQEGDILKRPLTCIYDQIVSSAPEGWTAPEWVRDPLLVLQASLANACDVAGTFASINGAVVTRNPRECSHKEE